MSSYVITGVSRGIGWEFLNQLSSNSHNTVIGIVRNKSDTDKRVAQELAGRSNITILEADLTKYDTLKKAAAKVATITGGRLDYLIANAGVVPLYDAYDDIEIVAAKHEETTEQFHTLMDTNVLANMFLYDLFLPQILRGSAKKVVVISSGMGDAEFTKDYDIDWAPLYSMSKVAMNMINAKFSARYKKDGILFLSICPGMVDVGHFRDANPEQLKVMSGMLEKFKKYSPGFKGPDTPTDSVKAVLSVVEMSSLENGDGGKAISHFGTKKWV